MQQRTEVVQYSELVEDVQKHVSVKYADREGIEEHSFFQYDNDYHLFSDDIVVNGEIIIMETHETGIYLFKDDSDLNVNEYIAERKDF